MTVRFLRLLAVAAGLAAVLSLTAPAAAVDVVGDDLQDSYVGSGSVIWPSTVPAPQRRTSADCPGCSWRADLLCRMVSASACRGAARLCRADEGWYRFYLSVNGGPWRQVGSGCIGGRGPTRGSQVEQELADVVRAQVPALRPGVQPRQALTSVPVVLWSGQPASWRSPVLRVLGHRVVVTARPTWWWQVEGRTSVAREPGGRWPDTAVTHAFSQPGLHDVRVLSRWSATYTVDGVGPFAVRQEITQEAAVRLRVVRAEPVLVR